MEKKQSDKSIILNLVEIQKMLSNLIKSTVVPTIEIIQNQIPTINHMIKEYEKTTRVASEIANSAKTSLFINISTSAIFKEMSWISQTLAEDVMISQLFENGTICCPYPYSRDTFLRLSKEVITETEIVEDMYIKLSSGELKELLEKQSIFEATYLCNKGILEHLKIILDRIEKDNDNAKYEFLWFFPIAEAIARAYVSWNSVFILDALQQKKDECTSKGEKKEWNRLTRKVENFIQDPIEKNLMLGSFEKAMGVAIQMFPAANFYYPFLAIKKAVDTRNDIIHGRIFDIKTEHMIISLSLLITMINFHLKQRELDPIQFEFKKK